MVRMLFLRDIDTDVLIRCRACGHAGVLPRHQMIDRYGPGYPVLSIAPNFRCSRCHSRDTESLPAPPPPPAEPAPIRTAPVRVAAAAPPPPPFVAPPPAPPAIAEARPLDADAIAALLGLPDDPEDDPPSLTPLPAPPLDDIAPTVTPSSDDEDIDAALDALPSMDSLRWLARDDDSALGEAKDDPLLGPPSRSFAILDRERTSDEPDIHGAMAALRGLVKEAAGEDDDKRGDDDPVPPPTIEPPPSVSEPGVEGGQSFENTLSRLRSLLDLDQPEPPPPPKRRGLFRRR